MPCRREEEEAGDEAEGEEDDHSFLLLQPPVTPSGSAEVDQLIAQIGQTLQLDPAHDGQASLYAAPGPLPAPPGVLEAQPADQARAPARRLRPAASGEARDPAPPGAMRCLLGERGRVRGRAAPYRVAEIAPGASALPQQRGLGGSPGTGQLSIAQPLTGPCRRGWLRNAAESRRWQQRRGSQPETRSSEDDPPRLLQQLLLSGNLIKEAVRRLHSRRLQQHPKVPAHPILGPQSAPVQEPPSPESPRAACSDPGACVRRAQLRNGDDLVSGS